MWWQKKKVPESSYLDMALGFLVYRIDLRLEGHCESCGAYQPIYMQKLFEVHGKTALFRNALKGMPCFFCMTVGQVSVRVTER